MENLARWHRPASSLVPSSFPTLLYLGDQRAVCPWISRTPALSFPITQDLSER